AEASSDSTRECWPGMDVLCARARMTPEGVRKALARLAGRGLECRLPLTDAEGNRMVIREGKRAGQPVYSHPGRRTTYRLPPLSNGETQVPANAASPRAPSTHSRGDGN